MKCKLSELLRSPCEWRRFKAFSSFFPAEIKYFLQIVLVTRKNPVIFRLTLWYHIRINNVYIEKSQAEVDDGTVLYRCRLCGQFWQKSIAWNWGTKDYLFKIPETSTSDLLKEQFMSPAEMLVYSSLMTEYFKVNKFIESKTIGRHQIHSTLSTRMVTDYNLQNLKVVSIGGSNIAARNSGILTMLKIKELKVAS